MLANGYTLLSQVNYSADSIIHQTAFENARNKSLRIQRAINIGSEYGESVYNIRKGHQFFFSDEELVGDIIYNDVFYTDLSLQYDLVQDEVVTRHANGKKIVLLKEKIAEFTLEGHSFKYLSSFNQGDKMKPGFYDVLVDGKTIQLLAKRAKRLKGQGSNFYYKKENAHVEDYIQYYLVKDNRFYSVRNYQGIMKLLSENGSDFRLTTKDKNREANMINIVKQYTSIK
jgi:hypothetical protein